MKAGSRDVDSGSSLVRALEFDAFGRGPAIVLIHGHPFDRSMWAPQRAALVAAGYRVILPDLRGYGATPATPGIVRMDELADDIVALLDRLEVASVAAIGLSMGGLVAMELAIRTDRLWALGLVATTAQPVTAEERARRHQLADAAERDGMAPIVDAMRDALFGRGVPPEVVGAVESMMTDNNPIGAAAALRGRAERPDYRLLLSALAVPAFVCVGTADHFSTAEVTEELVSCLPGATRLILPGIGHMPNLEASDEFNRALIDFLRTALQMTDKQRVSVDSHSGSGIRRGVGRP